MNQYMTCAQTRIARWLQVAEEQEQEAADRVGHQDVAPPQHERVREADDEQHRHPPRVEADALLPRGGAIHLDREADAEERREDRDELALRRASRRAPA